jgi:hypothetical protein
MKRISLFFALILLTGCLNYDESLVVNRDGSANLSIQLKVARQIREQMKLEYLFDQAKIQSLLPPQAKIVKFTADTDKVINTLLVEVKIPDLKSAVSSFGKGGDFFGEVKFSQNSKGDFVYSRSLQGIGQKISEVLAQQASDPRKQNAIFSILSRSYFTYRLQTPLKILENNANKVEGKILIWKIPVTKLAEPGGVVMTATFRQPPSLIFLAAIGALGVIILALTAYLLYRGWKRKKAKT